jgi:hypothetical protein
MAHIGNAAGGTIGKSAANVLRTLVTKGPTENGGKGPVNCARKSVWVELRSAEILYAGDSGERF